MPGRQFVGSHLHMADDAKYEITIVFDDPEFVAIVECGKCVDQFAVEPVTSHQAAFDAALSAIAEHAAEHRYR